MTWFVDTLKAYPEIAIFLALGSPELQVDALTYDVGSDRTVATSRVPRQK